MNRFTREDFENPPMQMRGARPFWAYVAERANEVLEKHEGKQSMIIVKAKDKPVTVNVDYGPALPKTVVSLTQRQTATLDVLGLEVVK